MLEKKIRSVHPNRNTKIFYEAAVLSNICTVSSAFAKFGETMHKKSAIWDEISFVT